MLKKLMMLFLPFYFSQNILADNSMQTTLISQQSSYSNVPNSCVTDNCVCTCQNYMCSCVCSTQYPERTTADTITSGTTTTTVSDDIKPKPQLVPYLQL